jgi:hypothetical protein
MKAVNSLPSFLLKPSMHRAHTKKKKTYIVHQPQDLQKRTKQGRRN